MHRFGPAGKVSKLFDIFHVQHGGEHLSLPEGEVFPEKLGGGGGCSPLLKSLTLFMTKICDIPYPFYDLTKTSKPYL